MENKKINLLHLVTGLEVGGAERVVLDLAKSANKSDFNVSVVSMAKEIDMLPDFEKAGVDIVALEKENNFSGFKDIVQFLDRYVKERKIEVIHAHMVHAMIAAVLVKMKNPKIKIVFTSHSINFGSKARKALIRLLKGLRSEDILFSEDQKSPIYKSNYKIIPNGIDTNAYAKRGEKFKTFTFMAAGRLAHVKNYKVLLESALVLKNAQYDFRIIIAGEGEQREMFEAYIKEHGLEKHVALLGLRSDIPELMEKSHAFAMTSLWEGLPIALLEAGASSLPIVTTSVGSIPSLIDETSGYLLQKDESPAEKMKEIMDHYDEAKKKADTLYNKVLNHYSLDSMMQSHENLYRSLIK